MIMRLASATKTFNFQSVSHKQLISKIERKKANNNVVGVENTIKICMHNTFFHFHSTDFFAFFHFLFINWGGYLENSDLFKCTGIPPCQNISINERPQILPVQKTKTAIAAVSCFFNKVSVKRKKNVRIYLFTTQDSQELNLQFRVIVYITFWCVSVTTSDRPVPKCPINTANIYTNNLFSA